MSTPMCRATTKSGEPCHNHATEGSEYCSVHARQVVDGDAPAEAATSPERERVQAVAQEFNRMADEVRRKDPQYAPPPFSAEALTRVLKTNLNTIAACLPLDVARDILRNLEGTKPSDLLDIETWKGLWYIIHYTAQGQAKELVEEIGKRLSFIPGMDMVTQFGTSVIESPGDLLDVETWKGGAVVLNAAVQANVSALRRRLLNEPEE